MKSTRQIGDKCGRLTVIGKERPPGSKRTIWVCLCDCGKQTKVYTVKTRSCGCLRQEKISAKGRRLEDLSGRTFKQFTVIKHSGQYKDNKVLWECRCVCGNIRFLKANTLKNDEVISCGCHKREKIKERRGEKHWNWKGGITPELHAIRNSQAFLDWRNAVFVRDNYVCQVCGTGGRLNAHHLDGFSSSPEKRLDIDNGVCLCYSCHTLFHKIYGKGNNTRGQFEEFCNERRNG